MRKIAFLLVLVAGCAADRPSTPRVIGVSAQTAGVVSQIDPDGTIVRRGDVIAELETGAADRRLFLAEDELRRARGQGDAERERAARRLLDRAQRELDWTILRAPVDGTVVARPVQMGQPVGAGTVVVAVAPDRPLAHR